MPDSLNQDDLLRLRAIYPEPPYRTHIPQYSMFMGAHEQEMAKNRKLVQGSTQPIMRLRKHENVSSKQPYTFYEDVELERGAPENDDFPFQSYYYLMDYDGKSQIAVRPGQVVYLPSAKFRMPRGYVAMRRKQAVQAPSQQPVQKPIKKEPNETFITLSGW